MDLLYKITKFLEGINFEWKLENTDFDSNPKTVLLSKNGLKKEFEVDEHGEVLLGEA
jgi:hypothetical protein